MPRTPELDLETDLLSEQLPKEVRVVAPEDLTLMNALEQIVISSEDSHLLDAELEDAAQALDYINSRLGLNRMQAIIFAICVDQSFDKAISLMDIRRWIDCPMISIMKYQSDVEELMERGYLMPGSTVAGEKSYAVPEKVVEGLAKNDLKLKEGVANLSFKDFFDKIGDYFMLRRQGWDFATLSHHIEMLTASNLHLTYCRKAKDLSDNLHDDTQMVLFHYFCHRLVNHDDSSITRDTLFGIFDKRQELGSLMRDLVKERSLLMKFELVEFAAEEGFAGEPAFCLTNKARQSFLAEGDVGLVEETQIICHNELISCSAIRPKELFYSATVATQIGRLQYLLEEANYQEICSRLEEHGMRKGFACLFYGVPGTGKTESVLQLARMTGRDIMQVDISRMRSKWVGESQKLVKSLFDRYRRAVKRSKRAPILLFNEADAILTKRNSSAQGSVDKMENAMQNIFLQEMEGLEGIMIATTNLTTNLDSAFERRFLYKVEFELPDVECRAKIWKSMISSLSDIEANLLASKYDFSGGQIENVSRKQIVDSILYGKEAVTADSLFDYCDTEHINNIAHKPVGFCV